MRKHLDLPQQSLMPYQTKQPVYFQPDPSFKDLSYTYSFDKYSCLAWVYPFHIIFAYLVGLSGLLAVLSRVIPPLRPYHHTFGRWYLIFMLWTMASSLVIYTNGLPMPILVSFLYLLFSITIGWNAIRMHFKVMAEQVTKRVNSRIVKMFKEKDTDIEELDIQKLQKEERTKISLAKNYKERLFSWRMLHGVFMTFSWCQMIGRIGVTNPFKSFQGCWTYPAYKSMDGQVYAVDSQSTPPFPMETGKFLVLITVPTVLIVLAVAIGSTYCIYKLDQKNQVSPNGSPKNSDILINQ